MLACHEKNLPDDDSIAAEINRKLNLGQANKPQIQILL
jgi:hypothetical protein